VCHPGVRRNPGESQVLFAINKFLVWLAWLAACRTGCVRRNHRGCVSAHALAPHSQPRRTTSHRAPAWPSPPLSAWPPTRAPPRQRAVTATTTRPRPCGLLDNCAPASAQHTRCDAVEPAVAGAKRRRVAAGSCRGSSFGAVALPRSRERAEGAAPAARLCRRPGVSCRACAYVPPSAPRQQVILATAAAQAP
jgi:hypothetical protein